MPADGPQTTRLRNRQSGTTRSPQALQAETAHQEDSQIQHPEHPATRGRRRRPFHDAASTCRQLGAWRLPGKIKMVPRTRVDKGSVTPCDD